MSQSRLSFITGALLALVVFAAFSNPAFCDENPNDFLERKAYLVKVLCEAPDAPFPGSKTHRAAQELSRLGLLNRDDVNRLFAAHDKGLEKGLSFYRSVQFCDALIAGGAHTLDVAFDRLAHENADERDEDFLFCLLGRLRKSSERLSALLEKRLRDEKLAPPEKVALRIALASVRTPTAAEIAAIEKCLEDSESRSTAMVAIANLREPTWLTRTMAAHAGRMLDELIKESIEHGFENQGSETLRCALFSRPFGTFAQDSAKRLHQMLLRAIDDDDPNALIIPLVLAQMTPEDDERILTDICRRFNGLVKKEPLGAMILLGQCPYHDANPRVTRTLVRLLSSNDEAVATGALWYCRCTGLAAEDSFPTVLQVWSNCKNAKRRIAMTHLLPEIADTKKILMLKTIAANEPDIEVRKTLEEGIARMTNLASPSDKGVTDAK